MGLDIKALARGALEEKFDIEVDKVINNIMDPNTSFKQKRKVTITLEFTPKDEQRDFVDVLVNATSIVAPYGPIKTAIIIGKENGEYAAEEINRGQIPGQTSLEDNDKVIQMNKEAN
ncbi:MAG: hypothetical protein CVV56_07975 [Tenericutes bacterium HGW-Tenericutes-1]|jgi:hypothetical protein|nr:MAG: hypothetical protein CVV56_07975 [Tenericutes bacterium HGW-Tenericutes-1]PKM95784.1 MAG: hypothetical protein CVU84_03005 [Firmicutes bacterium HGW-Firmicutes-1]